MTSQKAVQQATALGAAHGERIVANAHENVTERLARVLDEPPPPPSSGVTASVRYGE